MVERELAFSGRLLDFIDVEDRTESIVIAKVQPQVFDLPGLKQIGVVCYHQSF